MNKLSITGIMAIKFWPLKTIYVLLDSFPGAPLVFVFGILFCFFSFLESVHLISQMVSPALTSSVTVKHMPMTSSPKAAEKAVFQIMI